MNAESNLGWKLFFWSMGILQAISLGILFYISQRIETVNARVDDVAVRLSFIEGRMNAQQR